MKEIKIKIGEKEYKIRQSFRALLLFEELSGKDVSDIKDSVTDILKLFYCILKANNKDTFNYTFDEFIDLIDENYESVDVFSKFLTELNNEPKKKRVGKV